MATPVPTRAPKYKGVGGSFAPPLSDDLLASYRALIEAVPEKTRLREALDTLYRCAAAWWELPESTGGKAARHALLGSVVSLDEEIAAALWENIPWEDELGIIQAACDEIDANDQAPLRNAAFHLLWHVKELNLDREPLTADKL